MKNRYTLTQTTAQKQLNKNKVEKDQNNFRGLGNLSKEEENICKGKIKERYCNKSEMIFGRRETVFARILLA